MEVSRHAKRTELPDVGIEAKVGFLSRADAYPEATQSVEVVETHMSWVFLTERFAYKLKKPVRYEFLDFRSTEARRKNCEEEVRLNRRLAPVVYLGVVALSANKEGRLHLDGKGPAVDWLVKMHRLPREQMLDQAIANGRVTAAQVRNVGLLLAEFYRNAEPVPISAQAYREKFATEILANQRHLGEAAYGLPRELIKLACGTQSRFVASYPDLFDQRVADRRIVEAHGDLRPEHICLGNRPQIIDCLEFKYCYRILDPADELSFLALECERLGASFIGPLALGIYQDTTGDSPPDCLIAFYKSYRACLRAKIAAWHLRDREVREHEKWIDRAIAYLVLARTYAEKLI